MLADLSMMLLGGELKRRERLSARLGDVLSHLYLASAALKQFHDPATRPNRSCCCAGRWRTAWRKPKARCRKCWPTSPTASSGTCCMPWCSFGARHKGPSDALDAEVAALLGRPEGDPALERILDGMYRPQDPSSLWAR